MTGAELGGLVRTILAAFGGSFITSGVFTADNWQMICGAAGVVVAAVWSWWQKNHAAKKLEAAKAG